MSSEFYPSSLHHLLAEMERVHLLVTLQVARARQTQVVDSEFRGLFIDDREVDALLELPMGLAHWAETSAAQRSGQVHQATERLATIIDRRAAATLAQGLELRWEALKRLFRLSPFEADVLLVCLAPELDLRYERLYSYLQDDVTRKHPTVDLVLNLLCASVEDKLHARPVFLPSAALIKHQLLYLFQEAGQEHLSLLSTFLRVDRRVVDYLTGSDEPDWRLLPFARKSAPAIDLEEVLLPQGMGERLAQLAHGIDPSSSSVLYLHGTYGSGKRAVAEAICRQLGLTLLEVDGASLWSGDGASADQLMRLAAREAMLQRAALYWDGFDTLLVDQKQAERQALLQVLAGFPGLSFLSGQTIWEPAGREAQLAFLRVEIPPPTSAQRLQLWNRFLNGSGPTVGGLALQEVAGKFRFSGGQIRDAAATARSLARWRDPLQGQVTLPDLYAACRLQSNRNLSSLAQKISPHYSWQDIVLPPDRLEQLRAICSHVRYRTLVHEQWGFGRKLSLGKGLNALFAGPSGVGKTMAAEIIAKELGLDLYRIDLSTVVSKYIGETEKNLARIFAEAETSNAILFFDEADALFGKRSEVKDSHDRYANIEISYLLQKMEEHQGVVILATNLQANMDDAFVRRLAFTVSFPFPEAADRLRIWQGIWPAETPRATDLDLDFMARQFKLTGGNIRNIVVAAAFMAAEETGQSLPDRNGYQGVTMTHLVQATRREFQKLGKVAVAQDFGVYGSLVDGRESRVGQP